MALIRKAELSDLVAIKTIDQLLFQDDSYPLFALRQLFDITNGLLKVAEERGEVVGYIIAHYAPEKAEGWLLSLGVLPAHRGKQLGVQLMSACVSEIEAKGAKVIYLTVHPGNNVGIQIYERLDFVKHQELDDYYLDNSPRLVMLRHTPSSNQA